MKVYIDKKKTEKGGFLSKRRSWFEVTVRYELNDEEEQLLKKNKHVLNLTVFDFPWRGPDGNTDGFESPTVKKLIRPKGEDLGCAFSVGEVEQIEQMVNEGAKKLKGELYSGGGIGTTVTEI